MSPAYFSAKIVTQLEQNAFGRIDNIRMWAGVRALSEHFDASSDRHLA